MKAFHDLLKSKTCTKGLTGLTTLVVALSVVTFLGDVLRNDNRLFFGVPFEVLRGAWPGVYAFFDTNIGKATCVLLMTATLTLWIIRQSYRPRIILVKHATMDKELRIGTEFKKTYYCRNYEVTLTPQNNGNLQQLLSTQDKAVERISSKIREAERLVYYCGIAHTPLVFRMGYQLHGKNIRFLHEFRNGKIENHFTELQEHDEDRKSRDEYFEQLSCNATDLLVGIGATYLVQNKDLDSIDPSRSMHRFTYNIEEKMRGFDYYNSRHKIKSEVTTLVLQIGEICKKHKIERVHIVISASTAFTFMLAQSMNSNQIPEIAVYHYETSNYPWGILVREADCGNAVFFTESKS